MSYYIMMKLYDYFDLVVICMHIRHLSQMTMVVPLPFPPAEQQEEKKTTNVIENEYQTQESNRKFIFINSVFS